MDCIFCKIIKKELPAEIVLEDKNIIVFEDIHPLAPVHLLVVPKKHIQTINDLTPKDKQLVGEIFLTAKKVAEKSGIDKKGYKLVFNVGKGGGQIIFHLHLHLLGGWRVAKGRDILGMS